MPERSLTPLDLRPAVQGWLAPLAFFAAYVAGAQAGLALSFPGNFASFWPPTGIYLAALVLEPRSRWPRYVIAALAANLVSDLLLSGQPLARATGYTVANAIEALSAALVLSLLLPGRLDLSRSRHILALGVTAFLVSGPLSAVVGATVSADFHIDAGWAATFCTWWVSSVTGALVVLPALLAIRQAPARWRRPGRPNWVENCVGVGLTLAVYAWVFGYQRAPLSFLPTTVLLWAAIRHGVVGAAFSSLVLATFAVGGTLSGTGPFAQVAPLGMQILVVQTYLIFASMTFLVVGAQAQSLEQKTSRLRNSEAQLRDLLDSVSDMVVLVSMDRTILYGNPSWNERFAETDGSSSAPPQSLLDLVHPDDRERIEYALDEVAREGSAVDDEYRLILPDGSTCLVVASLLARIVGGRTVGIKAVLRDITADRLHQNTVQRYREQLEHANLALKRQANTDALTGVRNRRALDESFAEAVAHQHYTGEPLSMLLLDIDRFKSFNDLYGHPAGDRVLQQVAAIVHGTVRDVVGDRGLVTRYGGEEFAILLPGTPGAAALQLAETIRLAVAETPWPMAPITVSIGVASADADVRPEHLIEAADGALYYCKDSGRNRVWHATLRARTRVTHLGA